MRSPIHHLVKRLSARLGGMERARVIVVFACVLGLDGADKGSVGAMAQPVQAAFGIGKTELGLLLTVSLSVAAGATFFFGWLVDRVDRVRLLTWSVASWAVVMALAGFSGSYEMLLVTRLAIGAATACAAPAIASLIGDYFDPAERGSIYSSVLAGEIIGTGIGFIGAGELANWTWRAGFIGLAVPAVLIALGVRSLPEPARGGADRVSARTDGRKNADTVSGLARRAHVQPREDLVLHEDPRSRSLWWALRYILSIPTNVVLIVASGLAYFFFTGLRTFGVEYFGQRYSLGHGLAILALIAIGSGALAGVLTSGRIADRFIARGHLEARIVVAVAAFFASAGCFVLALLTSSLWVAMPLFALAAAGLGGVSPPLDAARLDIMVPGLWGRAEAVRTLLRKGGEAAAPISFGYLAEHVFGHGGGGPAGLQATFLVMSTALSAAGAVAWFAVRSYPRDVVTAVLSSKAVSGAASGQPRG